MSSRFKAIIRRSRKPINLNFKLIMNICLSVEILGALLEKSILLIRAVSFDKVILRTDATTTFCIKKQVHEQSKLASFGYM